jgi:hypothetical protein
MKNHLLHGTYKKRPCHTMHDIGIQVLSLETHKNVAGLNQLIGSQPPFFIIGCSIAIHIYHVEHSRDILIGFKPTLPKGTVVAVIVW